ncbi:MAG: type II toxin-antitoxin system VapC family toxin [Anaerolineales bacterium]|nr:type II toxin-antitoxin system VapC family toxin [Anaerolineales bacterium]
MKILDSDHCIAILRGKLDLRIKASPEEELAVTTISIGELTHGAYRSKNPADNLSRLDVLLAALIALPYDEMSARRWGSLKASLEREGKPLHDLDLQIASIAIENHATLLTHNKKHFERIEPLTLEDWLEA